MEDILLPTTIEFSEGDQPNVGKVVITPCHQGYGTTLGNALRRVLLSSLPGAAVESIKISGVQHEFSAVEGVKEDMIQIILNLKQLSVRSFSSEPVTLTLRKKGKGQVKANDFGKNADIEVINPDLVLFTVTDDKTIDVEITIGQGRGYFSVEEKNSKNLNLGTILIDSLYTPIRDVGYKVELTRVGDVTDYEKLTINIETNGAISPKEAIQQATRILMDHFVLILEASDEGKNLFNNKLNSEENEITETATDSTTEEISSEEEKPKKRGRKKKVEDA